MSRISTVPMTRWYLDIISRDVMARDPSRLVTAASGWHDHPVGHIADAHVYPGPSNQGAKVTQTGVDGAKHDPVCAAVRPG